MKDKQNKEKESETGEKVPTLKMFIHLLWSFHVFRLLPL